MEMNIQQKHDLCNILEAILSETKVNKQDAQRLMASLFDDNCIDYNIKKFYDLNVLKETTKRISMILNKPGTHIKRIPAIKILRDATGISLCRACKIIDDTRCF